jgi:hypothetical protein
LTFDGSLIDDMSLDTSRPEESMAARLQTTDSVKRTIYGTGLIEDARCLYSPSLPYRMQTDALLPGHLDRSDKSTGIKFDMDWAEGGVQQVWGLGVPFWRLPFEVAVRAVGSPTFITSEALGTYP